MRVNSTNISARAEGVVRPSRLITAKVLRGQITRTKRGSVEAPAAGSMRSVLVYATVDFKCWTTVMNALWRFFRGRGNHTGLGWLGGGRVPAPPRPGGPFLHFFPPAETPQTKP